MAEQITEEQKVHEKWYVEAKDITIDELPIFINHLINDYEHDYGTICHALAAGAIATILAMNKEPQGGITGFQAGAVTWEFIRHWIITNNKTALKLVNYDKMLYPQYEHNFQKTISKDIFEALKKESQQLIDKAQGQTHPSVYDHWQKIVNGGVPFGYTVSDDENLP